MFVRRARDLASRPSGMAVLAMVLSCHSSEASGPPTSQDAGIDAAVPVAAPFTIDALEGAHLGSHDDRPDFQRTSADVTIEEGPFADVRLIVDLTSPCFPFEKWKSDPPPSGQNWPASCDAFDRNFEIALTDPETPKAPGLELIRAITPFGGPLHVEADVTDVFNALHGKRRLEVTIPSYSDAAGKVSGSNGGWYVDARFEATPGPAPRKVLAVVPLVYDSDTKTAERTVNFTLPEGTTQARLEYLATGHGGGDDASCIGPAEEFCARTHTLKADGNAFVSAQKLWRTDCKKLCTLVKGGPFGEYCQENPCGAPSSVRAPRANWCPGSETPPLVGEPAELAKAGPHTFAFSVSNVADGGQWRISAKVFAYGE